MDELATLLGVPLNARRDCSGEVLADAEASLGFELPPSYRELMCWLGAGMIDDRVSLLGTNAPRDHHLNLVARGKSTHSLRSTPNDTNGPGIGCR